MRSHRCAHFELQPGFQAMLSTLLVTIVCSYYVAVCFPMLFEHSETRESMVSRAMSIRIGLGHHVSTSNPAVLLKDLLATKESRHTYVVCNVVHFSIAVASRSRERIIDFGDTV